MLDGPRPLVRVRQVVIYARGVSAVIKSYPKSETSRGDVALPPNWAVEPLRAPEAGCSRCAGPRGWPGATTACCSPRQAATGTREPTVWLAKVRRDSRRTPNALYKRFKARLRSAGSTASIRTGSSGSALHDLRHTFVSTLVNEGGMRVEDVQR